MIYYRVMVISDNIDAEIIDFIDLLNFTLSLSFIEKWKYRFSEKFIRHFQFKLLDSLDNQKPLKIDTLYLYLVKKCSYSREQVLDFFNAVDIEIYHPMVFGKFTKNR